jgi:beta-xylosidase
MNFYHTNLQNFNAKDSDYIDLVKVIFHLYESSNYLQIDKVPIKTVKFYRDKNLKFNMFLVPNDDTDESYLAEVDCINEEKSIDLLENTC